MEKNEFNKLVNCSLMEEIKEYIKSIPIGTRFTVSDCVRLEFYNTLETGNKSTLGTMFSNQLAKGCFPNVISVEKGTSGSFRDVCFYKKIKD
jgi:hypothetical protein